MEKISINLMISAVKKAKEELQNMYLEQNNSFMKYFRIVNDPDITLSINIDSEHIRIAREIWISKCHDVSHAKSILIDRQDELIKILTNSTISEIADGIESGSSIT